MLSELQINCMTREHQNKNGLSKMKWPINEIQGGRAYLSSIAMKYLAWNTWNMKMITLP